MQKMFGKVSTRTVNEGDESPCLHFQSLLKEFQIVQETNNVPNPSGLNPSLAHSTG